MKTKRTIYIIIYIALMLLPIGLTAGALPFLPAQVPAHYGFNGQVDRWGSKYELLLFPAITLLFGLILLAAAHFAKKQEHGGRNNETITLLTGLCGLLLFNLLCGYFLLAALRQVEQLSDLPVDLTSLIFIALGILLIICGNVMPKLKRNSIIGLRTRWSMKNETTWRKSQRFGGISFLISGAVMILAALLTTGMVCFACGMGILVLDAVIAVGYSRHVAKQESDDACG